MPNYSWHRNNSNIRQVYQVWTHKEALHGEGDNGCDDDGWMTATLDSESRYRHQRWAPFTFQANHLSAEPAATAGLHCASK